LLGTRLDEARDTSRYITGLGLLCTFWGLIRTVEAIQGLVHHMRSEQQLIREWVDAQTVQHREIRRLLEILARAPAHRD